MIDIFFTSYTGHFELNPCCMIVCYICTKLACSIGKVVYNKIQKEIGGACPSEGGTRYEDMFRSPRAKHIQ